MESSLKAQEALLTLMEIIRTLRSPDGCLWDRQQTKRDMGRYLMDEACEVIDAIDGGSVPALKEELGDLLFQILFLAVMAEEREEFSLADILEAVGEKMIRRHPHVFGNAKVKNVAEIKSNWQTIKRDLENKGKSDGLLDRVPRSLPALIRAQKMTEAVSRAGFDWGSTEEVWGKVEEELRELREAMQAAQPEKIAEELGDLLFSLVNLSRFVQVSADEALRQANGKFSDRFTYIEGRLKAQGRTPNEASLQEMDRLWEEYKSMQKR